MERAERKMFRHFSRAFFVLVFSCQPAKMCLCGNLRVAILRAENFNNIRDTEHTVKKCARAEKEEVRKVAGVHSKMPGRESVASRLFYAFHPQLWF